ncbi:hypothetical protein Zm00014a_022314, partial [Zea mays]
ISQVVNKQHILLDRLYNLDN